MCGRPQYVVGALGKDLCTLARTIAGSSGRVEGVSVRAIRPVSPARSWTWCGFRAAWSRLPAQDALAPKNLYIRVSIQLTADRFSQLAVVQLQLLSDTVKHRKVAAGLLGAPCSNDDFVINGQPCMEISAMPSLKTQFPDQTVKFMSG